MAVAMVNIRDSDRKLALQRGGSGWLWNPDQLADPTFAIWDKYMEETRKRMRVNFREGPLATSLRVRAITWHERNVSFQDGFLSLDRTRRLPTQTHELRHCVTFQDDPLAVGRYVTNVRFRWANECQGVAIELLWMNAQGALLKNMKARAEGAAKAFGQPFPGYNMQRIKNLKDETMDTLLLVINGKA